MRCRKALVTVMTDFTLCAFKQQLIMAALTDQQNLTDLFSVFEEIRANNEVSDVVITVRLLNTLSVNTIYF